MLFLTKIGFKNIHIGDRLRSKKLFTAESIKKQGFFDGVEKFQRKVVVQVNKPETAQVGAPPKCDKTKFFMQTVL